MISKTCCAVFCVLAMTSGVLHAQDMKQKEPQPIPGGPQIASMNLTSEQQTVLKEEALKGSGESALKLATYYSLFGRQMVQAIQWYTIGAENGNAVCMYSLWVETRHSSDRLALIRGRFWLEKAASLGDQPAAHELQRMGKRGN